MIVEGIEEVMVVMIMVVGTVNLQGAHRIMVAVHLMAVGHQGGKDRSLALQIEDTVVVVMDMLGNCELVRIE